MDPTSPPADRLLWSLRRKRTDVRCLLRVLARPVEVRVVQGGDIVFLERFPSEDVAVVWSEAYAGRLRLLGWFESPPDGEAT